MSPITFSTFAISVRSFWPAGSADTFVSKADVVMALRGKDSAMERPLDNSEERTKRAFEIALR